MFFNVLKIFVFQILMSLSHYKDTQGKCLSFRVDILERCGSYMRVLLYTIKRSLAKLNIKHRMCCNKPIDYKMLIKFFLDITAWLYGKEVTPIYCCGIGCAIFRALSFGSKIKILEPMLGLVLNFLVRLSWNTKLYFASKIWKGVLVLNGGIGTNFLIFLY